jgi:uncharacterized protein YbjT (DUF2867 family)
LKVLVTGASGFIGGHLAAALTEAGHEVIELVRHPDPNSARHEIRGDFRSDSAQATWEPRLRGIDAVINAVGILRERGTQTFAALHTDAPSALFSACVAAGVRKVIQISALGADDHARSRYHRSKAAAYRHLAALPLDWIILQPSLVFGAGGASMRLFATLAALPLVPLPGEGAQRVQPVHVADLAELCVRLLETAQFDRRVIAVVGPEPCSIRGLLAQLRTGMGLGEPRCVAVPLRAVRACARLAARIPRIPLDPEALTMLERGNTAASDDLAAALGREPQPISPLAVAAHRDKAGATADWARLNWLLPVLRFGIALVWIASGLLSLGIYPVQQSYALLARAGITGALAPVVLYAASALDLALGIATLVKRRRVLLWRLQMAVIVGYSLIIAVALPEYWLHPFAPVLKNVPLLAALALLHELERRG